MKFTIFEETYQKIKRTLVMEAWRRVMIDDVLDVVLDVTNECKDEWVKGETGKKVFNALFKTSSFQVTLGGREYEGNKDLPGYQWTGNSRLIDPWERNDEYKFMLRKIWNYWTRQNEWKHDDFSGRALRLLRGWINLNLRDTPSRNDYANVEEPNVAILAYYLWKPLNAQYKKIESNKAEVTSREDLKDIEPGKEVEVTLTVTSIDSKASSYGWNKKTDYSIVGRDEAQFPGISISISVGAELKKYDTDSSFLAIPGTEEAKSKLKSRRYLTMTNLEEGDVIKFKGKVKYLNNEWKKLFISYAKPVEVVSLAEDHEWVKNTKTLLDFIEHIKTSIIKSINDKCDKIIESSPEWRASAEGGNNDPLKSTAIEDLFKEIFKISDKQSLEAHSITEKAYKESGLESFVRDIVDALFHYLQTKNDNAGSYENLAKCAKAVKDICSKMDEYIKVE